MFVLVWTVPNEQGVAEEPSRQPEHQDPQGVRTVRRDTHLAPWVITT